MQIFTKLLCGIWLFTIWLYLLYIIFESWRLTFFAKWTKIIYMCTNMVELWATAQVIKIHISEWSFTVFSIPLRPVFALVFKVARGRIDRFEFVHFMGARQRRSRSHEKKRVRSRCPVFMSIFLVLPRGPLLTSPSSLSHSLRRSIIVSLCLALTFSFSRCGKPSANVLDGRCSDGATRRNTAQRCVARRCACAHCYTPHLFSFFSFSLSLSCTPQVTSNSPLHHADRSCCRAHYVINTFTSLALSERDDAISRRLLICVRAPMHVAGFRINVVDKFCDHRLNCIAKFAYWGLNWWKHVCSIVIFHKN